jgi:hypothetical protein
VIFIKLLLLLASFTFAPPVERPRPKPVAIEDPADCACRYINGKRVCNSACG